MRSEVSAPKKLYMMSPKWVKLVPSPMASMTRPGISIARPNDLSGSSSARLLLLISSETNEGKAEDTARIKSGVTSRTKGNIVTYHQIVRPMEKNI